MESKIITETPEITEIDWSKPQIVKSTLTDLVVVTSGRHTGKMFAGTVLATGANSTVDTGQYHFTFKKERFTPITKPITIKFIP